VNQFQWTPIGTPPPLPPQVEFTGERDGFFRLLARGAGLELVTLGFYRFWLITDIRRHLWSNTVIDGDAAEYTGRARELLIGFLIALAILVPIYLVYFLIGIEAEHWQAFASIPLFAAFYVFGQFAIYRARRYRLTRTIWRGVRFWMDGSGWTYAGMATIWALFAIVTLGIAMPWRTAELERYKMQHSWYGDLQGSFEGTGWGFFKRIWWMWLLLPGAVILFPALPFLYARYKAEEWRWWVSGLRFGGVTLHSKLEPNALTDLYWKVIGWSMLLSMGFGMLIGAIVTAVVRMGNLASLAAGTLAMAKGIPLLVVTVIGYMALALGIGVVTRLYLSRDLWARVLASTEVRGISAAANVAAKGELATAVGEGIADGLDVAGF
jgi:uncharacterized membrane protein YjgN (DUF898 family)